ncbi:MAG TPA: OstA-like protein, partial [Sphingobacteriaceae bacterium]
MRKLVVVLFFSVIGPAAFGQDVKKVQLLQSETLRGNPSGGTLRVIKPIFSHEGSTLSADSANFNQTANTFDAFGTVVITQTNGTTVYSDALNYNGNTRVALLTRNVRLVDGTATLTTDRLTYNMGTRIGTYTGGGKIVNEEDVLTSKSGYYFANSNDAYFRYDVDVMTPDAHITTDTLRYNSVTKIAYFYGPTNIYGRNDSTRLYTENGSYHTVTEQAFFGKKNLYTQGSKSLKGDSLFYDGKTGVGRAINNITFIDTAEKIILKGGLGVYNEADESTLVTRNAYVIFVTENDSTSTDSIY